VHSGCCCCNCHCLALVVAQHANVVHHLLCYPDSWNIPHPQVVSIYRNL
jgi:hypothetical protein